MNYCTAPLEFSENADQVPLIRRSPLPVEVMLDNWMDTILFTGNRRFKADEEFGFSFWDNEFITLNFWNFNTSTEQESLANLERCKQSIVDSIQYYLPFLRDVQVEIELTTKNDKSPWKADRSKYAVHVTITALIDKTNVAGIEQKTYRKNAVFYMDPFMK